MKIKVIKNAWYKQIILKEGDCVNFEGDIIPSWGEPVDAVKSNQEDNKQSRQKISELAEEIKVVLLEKARSLGIECKSPNTLVETLTAKIEAAEKEKLEQLKEEAVKLNIEIVESDTIETLTAKIEAAGV